MCLRAVVAEEEYALVAEVKDEEFKSDRLAAAFRISEGLRARRRDSIVVEDGGAISVRVPMGDATEREFEEAAVDLLEAASW